MFLCLAMVFYLCGCSVIKTIGFDNEATVIYREEGYVPKYAYQIFYADSLYKIDLIDVGYGIHQYAYAYFNTDGSLTDLTFQSSKEYLEDERKEFCKSLSDEQIEYLEQYTYFRILKLKDADYALFSNLETHGTGNYKFRIFKRNKNNSISFVDLESPVKGRISYGLDYGSMDFVSKNQMLTICGLIWFDYDLNLIENIEPVEDLYIDDEIIKEWLQRSNNKEVNRIVEESSSLYTYESLQVGELYVVFVCCYPSSEENSYKCIIEADLDGNIKSIIKLSGAEYEAISIKVLQEAELDGEITYYDVNY